MSPKPKPVAGALTAKRARFVAEFLIDGVGTAAARRAGYHPKHAPALLAIPAVAAAVQAGQQKALETAGVTKERLLKELGRIALANHRDFWTEKGDAKHPKDLSEDQGAAVAGFEVLIKNAKAGDGVTDTIHKFKLWDKVKAIELYMRHYGMLVDKLEVKDVNPDARVARLLAARRRAGQ